MKKLLLATALAAISALGATAHSADAIKVGFIYVGPIGDLGWT